MPPTAEAAKAYNKRLRETAAVLAGHSGGGHEYPFLCECGCDQTVKLALREYDRRGGAWLEAHRPASATP